MIAAFYLPDFLENKNGRHPDCIAACKQYGTVKKNYLYIEQDKLPSICGEFRKAEGKGGCSGCGNKPVETPKDQLKEGMEKEGIQWGTLIEKITSTLGIEQCPPCKARKIILNNVKKLGWKEAAKQLKATFLSHES